MDMQELEKLHSLKEKGIITEEEYNVKKQQILSIKTNKFSLNKMLLKKIALGISLIVILGLIVYLLSDKEYTNDMIDCKSDSSLCYVKEDNSLATGVVKTFKNHKLVAITQLKKGLLHGYYKEYYESGNLKIETIYKQGELFGKYKEYYENGKLKVETEYEQGNLSGKRKEYYESGQLKIDAIYKQGNLSGKLKEYYENGNLKREKSGEYGIYYFYDDITDIMKIRVAHTFGGEFSVEEYDSNGSVLEAIIFEQLHSEKVKLKKYFPQPTTDKSLQVEHTVYVYAFNDLVEALSYSITTEDVSKINDYVNNKIKPDYKLEGGAKAYYLNGQLMEEGNFVNGNLNGYVKRYFLSGKIATQEKYKNGNRHGDFKIFYETGEKRVEGIFEEGIITKLKSYYKNGRVAYSAIFEGKHLAEDVKVYNVDGKMYKTWKKGTSFSDIVEEHYDGLKVLDPLHIEKYKP